MARFAIAVAVICTLSHSANAQTSVYAPLSSWRSGLSQWESHRTQLVASSSTKLNPRPVLPGLRPVTVELLEDSVIRKHPKLQGQRTLARRYIEGVYRKGQGGRNDLRGKMAEALFLHKNPEWGYVSKPNASQHDVYRRVMGQRPPMNGQVKFHVSGKSSKYVQDMKKDYRAHRFFVPDDHVKSLRDHWLRKYDSAKQRGDIVAAKNAASNAGRVQPLGSTSKEIVGNAKEAFRSSSAESRAVYVSLAAGVALSLGQIGWDYAHGTISADQAAYRATKAATLIGTGITADSALILVQQGALRGTLRGTLIIGVVGLVVDTSWNVYEHGGMVAFRHPEFYKQLGGSVSAFSIGGVAAFYAGGAATAAASELGPGAPVVGGITALVTWAGVGTVAYIGGRSATSWLVQSAWPELYQQYEQQQIAAARTAISQRLKDAQTLKQ